MIRDLQVTVNPHTSHPEVNVPSEHLWSLVEFLGAQRVAVNYEYHPTHFIVHFQRISKPAVEQLLADWSHAEEHAAIST